MGWRGGARRGSLDAWSQGALRAAEAVLHQRHQPIEDKGRGLGIAAHEKENTLEFNADLSAFREKYGASNAELEFRATDAHPHWGSRSVQEKRTIVFDTYEFKSLLFNFHTQVFQNFINNVWPFINKRGV